MPWKVGGNFEDAWTTCETSWRECAVAIANYFWAEIVSDVAECLTKDGIIWILAIAVTFTILLRIKCCKNMHPENIVVGKRILSKVGYKIQDLELKVNVLTYKMQYGTWPLPHQIYNLNPKKLRKIKMTLSNPGDRKNWLKHALLSAHSRRPDTRAQNASARGSDLSKDERLKLQRRNVQLLHLNSHRADRRSSNALLMRNDECATTSTTNAKCNSACQRFTDTIRKCKSFLEGLKYNDERLLNFPLGRSEASSSSSSVKDTRAIRKPTLFVMRRDRIPRDEKEINEMKYAENTKDDTAEDEIYRSNVSINTVIVMSEDDASPKGLLPILPIIQPTRDVRSSRETLHEVRKKLQSLHNVLRTYENAKDGFSRGRRISQKSIDRIDEIVEAFTSLECKIGETGGEGNAEENRNADSTRDSRQTVNADNRGRIERNRSEANSSFLTEYSINWNSSNTSNKTCQCPSDATSRNNRPERYDQRCAEGRSAWTRDRPSFATTTASNSRSRRSSFYSAILQAPKYYEDRGEQDARERESKSKPGVHEDPTDVACVSFNLATKRSETEAAPRGIRYILSPESSEDFTKIQFSNAKSSSTTRKAAVEKLGGGASDDERHRENLIIISRNGSQGKISRTDDDGEEKSTALLLHEALSFKKALLTRIESEKNCPMNVANEGTVRDKSPITSRIESRDDYPPLILDIKADETIAGIAREKINQRYVHLDVIQRRDFYRQSLQDTDARALRCENEGDAENKGLVAKASSEYFSISDTTIRGDDEDEDDEKINRPLLSESPIYGKVISITMPVSVEGRGAIDTNAKSQTRSETILENVRRSCVNSCQNSSECGTRADDNDDDTIDKRSPTTLKFEDLVLERVKHIRDYMDLFIRSQNRAIIRAHEGLQCREESDIRRSKETLNRVTLRNRSIASSGCENADRVANPSAGSRRPDLPIKIWPSYRSEIFIEDDVLKRCSDVSLKRNPGMFTLVAPIKDAFSAENNARWMDTRVERGEFDSPLPATMKYGNDTGTVRKRETMNSRAPNCKDSVTPDIENKTYERRANDASVNFQIRGRRIGEDNDSKLPDASYFPFDLSREDANIARVTRDELATRCLSDTISRSNSYFTETAANAVKTGSGGVSSKRMSSAMQSRAREKDVTTQGVVRKHISADLQGSSANATSIEPSWNIENSNFTTTRRSNLVPGKFERDYSTDAKTTLNRSSVIRDSDASSFSRAKENMSDTDDGALNDTRLEEHDEAIANVTRLSSRLEENRSANRTYSEVKAKSDISLVTDAAQSFVFDFVNLRPKRSHSFVSRDVAKHIRKNSLHSFNVKFHDDGSKRTESESRSMTRSRSITPPQRISCIPVLRNRLETARRMRQARSPTRGPLTMLRRENICTKNRATDEVATESGGIPTNKYPPVDEVALNTDGLNAEKRVFAEEDLEKTMAHRSNNAKDNLKVPFSVGRDVRSLGIDEERSDKRFVCGSRSEYTKITEGAESAAPKTITIISIVTNDNLSQKGRPANSFILRTGDVRSTTDLLRHGEGLWINAVEKTEKEVTAKPSIMDTCTSMSDLHRIK